MNRRPSLTPMMIRRSVQLGTVAGMRSQLPLTLLAGAVQACPRPRNRAVPFSWLQSPRVLAASSVAAVGEMLGDKLPWTPSRLAPGPLLGRLVFGGAAAAGLAVVLGGPVLPTTAMGAAGAAFGAVVGNRARVRLVEATGIPDPLWAVVEDSIAVLLGLDAVRTLAPPVRAMEWVPTMSERAEPSAGLAAR